MATTYTLAEYADGDAVAAALDLAGTALQPADVGTAAAADIGDFATAAQGGLADTAVQPGDIGTAAAADFGDFATAAQGGLADTALQPNAPAQLGGAANYLEILADGTLRLVGAATVWDDIAQGIAAARSTGPGVSFNAVEVSMDFLVTANLDDYAVLPFQLKHQVKAGSAIYPHVHWEQAQANTPNWLMQYRWQRNGQPKTTAWTNYKCNTPAFTYTSGTLDQISYGAAVPAPEGYGISDIIQLRLLRDSANASGLFAGADPYTATVAATSFDPHVEIDSLGSASEYVK